MSSITDDVRYWHWMIPILLCFHTKALEWSWHTFTWVYRIAHNNWSMYCCSIVLLRLGKTFLCGAIFNVTQNIYCLMMLKSSEVTPNYFHTSHPLVTPLQYSSFPFRRRNRLVVDWLPPNVFSYLDYLWCQQQQSLSPLLLIWNISTSTGIAFT